MSDRRYHRKWRDGWRATRSRRRLWDSELQFRRLQPERIADPTSTRSRCPTSTVAAIRVTIICYRDSIDRRSQSRESFTPTSERVRSIVGTRARDEMVTRPFSEIRQLVCRTLFKWVPNFNNCLFKMFNWLVFRVPSTKRNVDRSSVARTATTFLIERISLDFF